MSKNHTDEQANLKSSYFGCQNTKKVMIFIHSFARKVHIFIHQNNEQSVRKKEQTSSLPSSIAASLKTCL